MSSYRDGRPWDGGPPGAEQDYSGRQYSAPIPATDPWTGVSYAQYAQYDYSAYGSGYNYAYDPTYYQQQQQYYGGKGYPAQGNIVTQAPYPTAGTSKTYHDSKSRSRSRSKYSRRERSYSRTRDDVSNKRSRSRSKKPKMKRYSRSSSRSYSRSPVKIKQERRSTSTESTKQLSNTHKVSVKVEKRSKSRSRSPRNKDNTNLCKDGKMHSMDNVTVKKEKSPQRSKYSKLSNRLVSPAKSNQKSHTPPSKHRKTSVTPPKCYARSRSASSSRSARSSSHSSRRSWRSRRTPSRSPRVFHSRSHSRSPRLSRNKARRNRSGSRSLSHRSSTRSRSTSRRRKSRSSSASDRHSNRSRSKSRRRTKSKTSRRSSKSRSKSRRRSSRSVSDPRRRSSRSRSGSRHHSSRSRSRSRQKVGKNKPRRSHSKSRDHSSSRSISRNRSHSDDDERRGQFTVADRKRFWKRHRNRIEDKDRARTPPIEVKAPPGAVEASEVDDIEYGDPPEVDGPNFAELLPPTDPLPSTSKKGPIPIKNDGSFLEMFKKMQEEKKKAEEAEKKNEIKKPMLPFIGKRRGGRVLKTGLVKKTRAIDEQSADTPKDAWSLYMQEVKKYRETSCEEERKTRPLVK